MARTCIEIKMYKKVFVKKVFEKKFTFDSGLTAVTFATTDVGAIPQTSRLKLNLALLLLDKALLNGDASRRKFSTCVYLRLRLARTCVHFRPLWSRSYLNANQRKILVRLATQRKSVRKSNLRLLVLPFGQGLRNIYM